MKKYLILAILIFFTKVARCQLYDRILKPESMKEYKIRKLMENMNNYDSIVGKYLGKFSATNIDNQNYKNKNLKGKVTFINFWFSSCAPCVAEFEEINKLYNKYKLDTNFQILTFTFDNKDVTSNVVKKHNLLYKILFLSNEECHDLMFDKGFPCNFLIDTNGKIVLGSGGLEKNGINPFSKIIIPKIDLLLLSKNKFDNTIKLPVSKNKTK